ncbi:transposase [Piscinibacter sp. XHJ-5]|uniref:transposase n=1 Tax=Piscinibacter sp. XHJ-5 TaxID=3037797 RepID=UPI00245344BF|nr:transposase [Piscinibacter sp. XHJ-5]
MARLPRLVVAGQLHLLVQRSHGHSPVFRGENDFQAYRRALTELAPQHQVAVHAYALLPTQVWLLVTPSTATALSRLWQALGRRFGADYNRRHGRSGVLWEGRFRTTVVDPAAHLLDCCRRIEWAPVRAGLADTPADYAWSSAAHHMGQRVDPLITEHPGYWALGNTPFEREAGYRRLLDQPLPAAIERRLDDAVMKGWALGGEAFVRALGELTDRRPGPLPRGRPRKVSANKTVP